MIWSTFICASTGLIASRGLVLLLGGADGTAKSPNKESLLGGGFSLFVAESSLLLAGVEVFVYTRDLCLGEVAKLGQLALGGPAKILPLVWTGFFV